MANLQAIGSDGQSIIFLRATGTGLQSDPFVLHYAVEQIGTWVVDLPAGAATSANQATVIGRLDGIEGLLSGVLTVDTGLTQPLTNAELRANPIAITDDGGSITVDGTFWQATQPVSFGSLPTGSNVIGSIANTEFAVTQSGTWTVSGTFFPDTQPISAAALPLPAGAATSANQSTIIGHLDGLEGLLAGTLTVNTGLTPLTDAQLRATAVPVSGTFWQATQPISAAALPLPDGAATSANQRLIPGFSIPEHDTVVLTEDANSELVSVAYSLSGSTVRTLTFAQSGYTFVTPYKTTTITRS